MYAEPDDLYSLPFNQDGVKYIEIEEWKNTIVIYAISCNTL